MTHCYIYSPDEGERIGVPITKDSLIKSALMGDNYISLVFNHTELPINRGWYIGYKGRKWEIMDEVIPERLGDADGYRYEIKFYAQQHHMKRGRIFWSQNGVKEATFNLTTTLSTFAELICENMNAFLGVDYWRVGNIPEEISDKVLTYSFDGISCWDAVVNIANVFETEWWVEDDFSPTSVTLNFGKCLHGDVEEFAEGGVISKVPITKRDDDSNYGTRFYVFGGTRNIPVSYRHTEQGGVTNHISERRLRLPSGLEYIDAKENLEQQDIIEQVLFFDDIYPKNEEVITDVQTRVLVDEDTQMTVYRIFCNNTAFVPENIISGETLGATFTSGSLQGRDFELSIIGGYTNFQKGFEIVVQHENAGGDSDIYIPNEYLFPKVGDKFILTGVELPQENINSAELNLLIRGKEEASLRSKDANNYECDTNPIYCRKNNKNFNIGQKVLLIAPSFGPNGRESRVLGFEKKLFDEYQASYTIGENLKKSRYQKVEGLVVDVKKDTQTIAIGERIDQSRNDFQNITQRQRINDIEEGVEELRFDTAAANDELRASILATDKKTDEVSTSLEVQKEEAFLVSKQVSTLISDDINKSVRTIAAEVAAENIPTEVATAMQKVQLTSAPSLNAYTANIVYDWVVSVDDITISNLYASNSESYDNVWVIRFGCQEGTKLNIVPTVYWENGAAPAFGEWGICELTFTRASGGSYLGTWKVYK